MTTTPPPWPGDPLLERELELAAADRAVDALCRPRPEGGLLVYSGAAGIGKTSVLARVRARAAERCTVRTTRADPATGVTHMTPQEQVAENLLLLQVDFLKRSLGMA
ncbi:AAA family ATPase [Streptomyces albidoflavus]|uniref:AAA family ATPase n=1 Tax=Streptomyces albidoflavus TaxID=1886 RepID=UPI0033BE122B